MKTIIAPDSFKGNMRSTEVCEIVERAMRDETPDMEIVSIPMADGGEGTVEAVVAATGGVIRNVEVTGPVGDPVQGAIGVLPGGQRAVIEMASASGIEKLTPDQLNPLVTTTFGTGELILAAMEMGISDITLGIGGSATVDGGVGMAKALGFGFETVDGAEIGSGGGQLAKISHIDSAGVDPRLKRTRFRVACDVTNPLLGETGAAVVFGPQKGATPEMVDVLEAGLDNLAVRWKEAGLLEDVDRPGDGAAGGLGAGLRAFCNAEVVSGAGLVAEITGLEQQLESADLLVTGEGRTDAQTKDGKLCSVVAELASKHRVPTILVSGSLDGDLPLLLESFTAAFSISHGPITLEEALASSRENLYFTVRSICRNIGIETDKR